MAMQTEGWINQELVRETSDILFNSLDAMNGGSFANITMYDFALPATAWGAYLGDGVYPYYAYLEMPDITSEDTVAILLSQESRDLGYRFASFVVVENGRVQIRCTDRPSHTISGRYSINALAVLSTIDVSLLDKVNLDFLDLKRLFLDDYSKFKDAFFGKYSEFIRQTEADIDGRFQAFEEDAVRKFEVFKESVRYLLDSFGATLDGMQRQLHSQIDEFQTEMDIYEKRIDGNIDDFEGRLNLMEDQVFSRVGKDGQSYLIEFNTLDGLILDRGIFHEEAKRIEC